MVRLLSAPVALALLLATGTATPAGAVVVWTGAAGSDIFDDANWDFSNSGVASIAFNTDIADDISVVGGSLEIPNEGGQVRFQIGAGFTLTVDDSTIAPVAGGNDGVGGAPGSAGVTVDVINGSAFNPFFIVNQVSLNIDGTSSATFGGGGNPINLSTVNLSPGAVLAFTSETVDAYTNEHLSKTFVNGEPAVIDVNITLESDGAAGSIITAVPEPAATAGLAGGLALLALLVRRRR